MALVAVGFERARPAPPRSEARLRPPMAHPRPSVQDHPGPVDGPGRPSAVGSTDRPRGSAVGAIALTVGTTMFIVGAVYDVLAVADPMWSFVTLIGGSFIAGLITAPERRDEGAAGFALGMVVAVGAAAAIATAMGRSGSNPVSAVVGLWLLGPVGFIPGWAIGGRRHRRRDEERPVRSVPRRPVPR